MSTLSSVIGGRIRSFRKEQGMTLQELADQIYKSRATVSKYESGEIVIDIETLTKVSEVLHVPISQLAESPPVEPALLAAQRVTSSSFYQADRMYFYFFDGRYNRLKDGIIDIHRTGENQGTYDATLAISAVTQTGRNSMLYYTGKVMYSDMLIRFTFTNKYNALEEALLYIFNPLEVRDVTKGILYSISSADLCPCAIKCLITLNPQKPTEEWKSQLLLTKAEMQRWKKANMWIIDNRG